VTSPHFIRVASLVTEKVTQLLYALVWVTNDRGVEVTSSDADRVGRALNSAILPLGIETHLW
jgi:hypothetical protein